MLPLLWYSLSLQVKKVLMLCRYQAATSHFFFHVSMELARSCCRPKQRPLLCSIFQLVIGLWVKYDIGTKQHVRNWILCKTAGLNWGPIQEKGICSDSNRTAQQLQMAARKSLETMSGVILNWLQPNLAAKSVANEMWCLKAMKWPASTGWPWIFDFNFFLAICLCKQSSTVLLTNYP